LLGSNISSTCPHNMANFGPLAAEIGSGGWCTPANFNGFRVLASLVEFTGGQPNFASCLAVSWTTTLYIHFRWLLLPDGISPRAKFTLGPSLAFSHIGSFTARRLSSGRQPKFAARYKELNYGTFAEGASRCKKRVLGILAISNLQTSEIY